MTSKKVIELFYDVVSPYSWLGFEVSVLVLAFVFLLLHLFHVFSYCGSSVIAGHVSLQKHMEHRPQATPRLFGWRHAWSRYQPSINCCCTCTSVWTLPHWHLSYLTGNKPPGMVPNKSLYMHKDLTRLAKYFNVPLQSPSDPAEVMFIKGTNKHSYYINVQLLDCIGLEQYCLFKKRESAISHGERRPVFICSPAVMV